MTVHSTPTVSVIVPFYNIEKCVAYCTGSLLKQSYQNCEFIFVDDGSTDCTPRLLDEVAAGDSRVKVFHTNNGGLSAARNYGVKASSGSYVTFVDGDDIVDSHYVGMLVDALNKSGCKIVLSGGEIIPTPSDGKPALNKSVVGEGPEYVVCSQAETLKLVCYDVIGSSAWGNLCPRDYYLAHGFPEGQVYEDTATIANLICSFENAAILQVRAYGYVVRSNSIAHRKRARIKQANDYVDAINSFCQEVKANGIEIPEAVAYFQALHYCRLHDLCKIVVDDKAAAKRIDDMAHGKVCELLPKIEKDEDAPRAQVKRFKLFAAAPGFYDVVFILYKHARRGI